MGSGKREGAVYEEGRQLLVGCWVGLSLDCLSVPQLRMSVSTLILSLEPGVVMAVMVILVMVIAALLALAVVVVVVVVVVDSQETDPVASRAVPQCSIGAQL